ncbi:hypothetical protein BJY04DRAFT_194095 [Aspergillus karnatakaensis]|uniref:uncharacterized protein n=1 Tax=Aspergillus karnatakaensis TaxID=1810916 RepID=UPI003CCDC95C
MSSSSSISQKAPSSGASSIHSAHKTSTLSKIRKHLANVKQEWGPGLAAKESWDDDYNFPAGRWAGQGLDYSYRWGLEYRSVLLDLSTYMLFEHFLIVRL